VTESDLILTIDGGFEDEATQFFNFLKQAARLDPLTLSFRRIRDGSYAFDFSEKSAGALDAFLQDLLMGRGLYYYGCTVKTRRKIASKVIAPIFQQILESRFRVTHSRSLRSHILGYIAEEMIPSDLEEAFAHRYEMLVRKLDIRLLTPYDFVRDVDDLLTEFMLSYLGHKSGDKSPEFNVLVGMSGRANITFNKDARRLFSRIHELRTRGLHRLERNISETEVSTLALELYFYFQYFDEFQHDQLRKTIVLNGRRYRRIKYGAEAARLSRGKSQMAKIRRDELYAVSDIPCHDCYAVRGQYHCGDCDMETCPRCLTQLLSCDCEKSEDED
jgi:hypothetical protein